MRRIAGRQDKHALERKTLERGANQSDMTEMRRIEGAAEDPDSHRLSPFPAISITESLRTPA
jgi:hypothetical protein